VVTVVWKRKSRYGYECRVVKRIDANGNPIYTAERNMGKYDGQFYICLFTEDKDEALRRATSMCR